MIAESLPITSLPGVPSPGGSMGRPGSVVSKQDIWVGRDPAVCQGETPGPAEEEASSGGQHKARGVAEPSHWSTRLLGQDCFLLSQGLI